MGFNNPDISWSKLEAALAGRDAPDGGDGPAFSRKREPYVPPEVPGGPGERVPYAELHCHSNFSFLDGASHPHELVEQAARLGLDALTLTDHDGMYGAVRFAEAGRELGVATAFGAELSLGLTAPQNGVADPEGAHLLLLARDPDGYRALCHTISTAQLRGREKGRPIYDLDEVITDTTGHVVVLTGCRKGTVQQALHTAGVDAAEDALRDLVARFGLDNVVIELTHTGLPTDSERNDALAAVAARVGVATVATTAAHYATSARFPLATALAAVRARRSLDDMDGWLPAAGMAQLRSGAEMAARFDQRYPGAVARAADLGRDCAFPLDLVAPRLPPFSHSATALCTHEKPVEVNSVLPAEGTPPAFDADNASSDAPAS